MNLRRDPILWTLLGAATLLVAAAFIFGGAFFGVSAMGGVVVAIANWIALKWIGARIAASPNGGRAAGLLIVKGSALLAIITLIVLSKLVDPVGFIVGLASLVVGVTLGGLISSGTTGQGERADAAR